MQRLRPGGLPGRRAVPGLLGRAGPLDMGTGPDREEPGNSEAVQRRLHALRAGQGLQVAPDDHQENTDEDNIKCLDAA